MLEKTSQKYVYKIIQSPVENLKLIGSDKGLAAIVWEKGNLKGFPFVMMNESKNHTLLREAESQLKEYFAKKRKKFNLELDFQGTDFQKKVWKALLNIPFGTTNSYGEIAKIIGSSKASRAVGAASGKNPICIIAPCHRVIGASGKLTGYAGGVKNKALLLKFEGSNFL